MFKIFTDLLLAQNYCEEMHRMLQQVRVGYCAVKWDNPRKHPTKNEWAVVIPCEDDTIGVSLSPDWEEQ